MIPQATTQRPWLRYLRHRIGIYAPNQVADDLGGTITSWSFQRAVWASVVPKSINENWQNGRLSITETFRLTIRYAPDFPHRARIVWRGRTLRVVASSDPDARGERLHLVCEEVIR